MPIESVFSGFFYFLEIHKNGVKISRKKRIMPVKMPVKKICIFKIFSRKGIDNTTISWYNIDTEKERGYKK